MKVCFIQDIVFLVYEHRYVFLYDRNAEISAGLRRAE